MSVTAFEGMLVEGSGLEPLTGQVPDAAGGTNRPPYKTGPGEGYGLNSKPFPLGRTRSHNGGGRAKIHHSPRHRDPVVHIASSAIQWENGPGGCYRPANLLAQNLSQNLLSPPNARIVEAILTTFLEATSVDKR